MLTIIETLDGRVLITDKKDIRGVVEEARDDLVELPERIKDILDCATKSNASYILVSRGEIKFEEACKPKSNLK